MKCAYCKADNPPGTAHCASCGASLESRRPSWVGITLGVLLLIVFIPIGLCGLLFSLDTFWSDDPETDYWAPVGYVSLAVSAFFVYVAYLFMRRQ